tara:strand:+ start:2583 stop:3884 length:1302 start_codon:yes stop_codon:yes gene_type:complete
MAKGIGIKVPKKKARLAPAVRRGEKITGLSWEGCENWSGYDYHVFQRHSKSFYYDNYKSADLELDCWAWMKENDYTAEQIKCARAAKGAASISVNTAILCKLLRTGMMDLNPKHALHWDSLAGTTGQMKPVSEHIRKVLENTIVGGAKEVAKAKVAEKASSKLYIPTIQERIADQAWATAEPIEEWLEIFITDKPGFDPKGFDFKVHFSKAGTTQAHARKMKTFFEKELLDFEELDRMPTAGQLKKMTELEADMWTQLKEGYIHLKKADIAKYTSAIENLMQALDYIIDASKATRKPRIAKPKSADKLVVKLKYMKLDDKYKLASINPVDVVGANELWTFNVKTRKLGKYVATNIDPTGMGRGSSGLQVKGTTITGFNEELSIQKTLRKPDEQLKALKAAGKVALRTFLENINAIDTKMNGRINIDTILLKVS